MPQKVEIQYKYRKLNRVDLLQPRHIQVFRVHFNCFLLFSTSCLDRYPKKGRRHPVCLPHPVFVCSHFRCPRCFQAMMHAASRGFGHIVRHLVEAGADGAIYNLSGQTAADLALANGFHAVCIAGRRGIGIGRPGRGAQGLGNVCRVGGTRGIFSLFLSIQRHAAIVGLKFNFAKIQGPAAFAVPGPSCMKGAAFAAHP